MKYIYAILIALVWLPSNLQAQVVKGKSAQIMVDFSEESPSELRLLKPEIAKTRGFIKVMEENLEVEGIVSDKNGLKSLYLNDEKIFFDNSGYFSTKIYLAPGENKLKFEVQDESNVVTPFEFFVELEEEVVVATNSFGDTGKYYALIVAVEEYQDRKITQLDNPVKDATALHSVLINNYSFEEENTILLTNPTKGDILDQFDVIDDKITENDNLLIFYAGHGHWDSDNKLGYWLPSDAQHDRRRQWVGNSEVKDFIKRVDTRHTLLVTDACFGGSIFKTRKAFMDASLSINKLYETTSRKAMTSGTLTEVPDESVFMQYILKNLENNDEKYMPSEHLFFKIKPAVTNNSETIPQYGVIHGAGDEGGDFIFIKK